MIKKCIAFMHCKSLWIKASAKCINVNVIHDNWLNSRLVMVNIVKGIAHSNMKLLS